MTVPTCPNISNNLYPTKSVYAKNVKNWEFFQERYATKWDWLAWYYKFKENIIDHRSYAEVVRTKNTGVPIIPSIEKSA